MHEDLERMIRDDTSNCATELMNPVFLDSESLSDLATLSSHVQNSRYLMLLLTPGFLSRPWCLAEIVHAIRQTLACYWLRSKGLGRSSITPHSAQTVFEPGDGCTSMLFVTMGPLSYVAATSQCQGSMGATGSSPPQEPTRLEQMASAAKMAAEFHQQSGRVQQSPSSLRVGDY